MQAYAESWFPMLFGVPESRSLMTRLTIYLQLEAAPRWYPGALRLDVFARTRAAPARSLIGGVTEMVPFSRKAASAEIPAEIPAEIRRRCETPLKTPAERLSISFICVLMYFLGPRTPQRKTSESTGGITVIPPDFRNNYAGPQI